MRLARYRVQLQIGFNGFEAIGVARGFGFQRFFFFFPIIGMTNLGDVGNLGD